MTQSKSIEDEIYKMLAIPEDILNKKITDSTALQTKIILKESYKHFYNYLNKE